MKKILLLLFGLMSIYNVKAEDKSPKISIGNTEYFGTTKRGFSLSLGALPVVNFVGNMFNNTENQSFDGFKDTYSTDFKGNIISASYFIADEVAITTAIGINRKKHKTYTYDDNDNKESIRSTGSNGLMIMIGANYLLRPGARIQPIIGGRIAYGLSNNNFEKVDDQTSVNADFNHKYPSKTFGIIGNVGIEYFLSKTTSISAFTDLSIIRTTNKSKIDDWDEKKTTLNSTQTEITTGQVGANLVFNFYF